MKKTVIAFASLACLVAGGLTACRPAPSAAQAAPLPAAPPPAPLVDLAAIAPQILQEVRYAGTNNFTGAVLPGYAAPRVFLREKTARALAQVAADLDRDGLLLKVFDGYRPLRARRRMADWARSRPGIIGVYVGEVGPARRLGHECGNAVDLTLVRKNDHAELAMGTDFDEFSRRSWTFEARGEALTNRLRLRRAMVRRGFAPYDAEWWHFTFTADPGEALDVVIE